MTYYEPKDDDWFEKKYCPTCTRKDYLCLCDQEIED